MKNGQHQAGMRRIAVCVAAGLVMVAQPGMAREIAPLGLEDGTAIYSERTLSLALQVDRDGARLLAYTVKARPFRQPSGRVEPSRQAAASSVRIEVVLLGPGDARHTRSVELGSLCIEHDASTPAHIQGDTFRPHRESFVVEMPEVPGFDRLEVAHSTEAPDGRRRLAVEVLD